MKNWYFSCFFIPKTKLLVAPRHQICFAYIIKLYLALPIHRNIRFPSIFRLENYNINKNDQNTQIRYEIYPTPSEKFCLLSDWTLPPPTTLFTLPPTRISCYMYDYNLMAKKSWRLENNANCKTFSRESRESIKSMVCFKSGSVKFWFNYKETSYSYLVLQNGNTRLYFREWRRINY